MSLKARYFVLCVLGTFAPLSPLAPFVRDHGFDARLMIQGRIADWRVV